MGKVGIVDFVPPIFVRVIGWLGRYFRDETKLDASADVRYPPFDSVPSDIDVKWVLDIGANVGNVSKAALQSYPECNVICFEPVQETFAVLKKKLDPYSKRVHMYNIALSDHSGKGTINLTNFDGANSIMPQADFHKNFNPHVQEVGSEEITLVTLDEFSGNLPAQYIDIMKIDVEGYELAVLNGGAKFIEHNVDTIIIEIALMRDASWDRQGIFDIFHILNKMGFRLINIIDLCHVHGDSNMMLVQMDCIFRKKDKLSMPK